jgi:single-stranded-DNA-specific exonuclease
LVLSEYIDFAALGTIADCMPLIGENRTIASLGLTYLKKSRSHGLRRIIEGRYVEGDADIVGFHIGPRINAAGRMDSPYKALNLLLATEDRLDPILEEIEFLNTKRKTTTEYFIKHAMEVVDRDAPILFYDSIDIGHGIIGLVAGRLTDTFDKPSIVLKDEGDRLVASCRSPEYIDITNLLETCVEYFITF